MPQDELIHAEANAPMELPSLGASWYLPCTFQVQFIFTIEKYMYMLKNKSEIKDKLEE